MQATAQKRLDILRSLAAKNEEAAKENSLDAVDSEAVQAVSSSREESIDGCRFASFVMLTYATT